MNEEGIILALMRQVLNGRHSLTPGLVNKQRTQATVPFRQDAHLGWHCQRADGCHKRKHLAGKE